jgi:hypothetical protein
MEDAEMYKSLCYLTEFDEYWKHIRKFCGQRGKWQRSLKILVNDIELR